MAQLKKRDFKNEQFKKIARHLSNYHVYKAGIINLQNELDRIMPGITVSYEVMEGSIGTFTFKSKTEDYAIDRIESKRALQLHEDIATYKIIVESIDNALAQLDEKERDYVRYRYIQGNPVHLVAQKLCYSERQCQAIRDMAKDKLLITLKNIVHIDI